MSVWAIVAVAVALLGLGAVTVWALVTRVDGSPAAASRALYVAIDGDDANPGTEAEPFGSIQRAVDLAGPGTTIFVRGGTYRERVDITVSGSEEAGRIVLRNQPGETPILDGSGLTVPAGFSGMISIESRHHVTLQGLDVRGYRSSEPGHVPVGVWVDGRSSDISVLDMRIHALGTDVQRRTGADAHGIAVYGTDASSPIADVVLDGNEVFDLNLGSSESVVVNGNVQGFEITGNEVHDNDNIGIDVIGFEGKVDDPSVDQARNGLVAGNLVYNIDSFGNPAYGEGRSADGIYVDGGRDVIVERNVIHDVNIGIELASEHAGRSTSDITVRNNVVHDAGVISLAIGGYDRRRGSTEDSVIVNNTFVGSDGVELLVQFDTRNNVIQNNIVAAESGNFLENSYAENVGNLVDNNLYYSVSGVGSWEWKGRTYPSFEAYQRGTDNDTASIVAAPLFVDAEAHDYRLAEDSPAVDSGAYLPRAGHLDLAGSPRLDDGRPDLGAFERPMPPPSPTPTMATPTYVSDMTWRSASNGWGPAERDLSNGEKAEGDGTALTIDGAIFAKGIGVHAPSRIVIQIDGTCSVFAADVGLDDETGTQGSVSFEVWGDGARLGDSGLVDGGQPSRPLVADIAGVRTLELRVRPVDGVDFDHADWADARIDCA
ncbi:MAG: NPCBM/NEW2 domain-containing protein [Actinomycetota bacterium]